MIRKYLDKDNSQLIELLRENIPTYFDVLEEVGFDLYHFF